MSNVLYMAISSDGFIADANDETSWSDEEWAAFQTFVDSCDFVVMGRRTYEIMKDELVEGPEYLIATDDPSFDASGLRTISIQSKKDLPAGHKVGIIGGGELNGRLAKMGALDEIILDIEPITLGDGMRLFGTYDIPLKLELIGSRHISEQTIQRHYRVAG